MSIELIHKEVSRYQKEISSGETTLDDVINDVWKSCFAKPGVSKSAFMKVCRKYDPDFAPIASKTEREERAELTRKVQDGFKGLVARKFYDIDPQIDYEYGNHVGGKNPVIQRWHRILFRGLDVDQQRDLVKLLEGGDKKALGQYFADRVLSKKDELRALLDMNDAELVENFFRYKDELDLVKEIQKYSDCIFDEQQQKDYAELYDLQSPLENLVRRVDMIASPYYADYPCERLQMSDEAAMDFYKDMTELAKKSGESIGSADEKYNPDDLTSKQDGLGGPSFLLGSTYNALRGMAMGVLDQKLGEFVKPFGGVKARDCIWAGKNGKAGMFENVMDLLNQNDLIFVDIPGAGTKALYNSGSGFADCRPTEATPEIIARHMCRAAEKGMERISEANPFFLSVFTGSDQYKQMEEQHKMIKELMPTLKFPLSEEQHVETMLAVAQLQQSVNNYLSYKKNQGLEEEKGVLVGRSANERKRLAAAQEAMKLSDELSFMLQYQQDARESSRQLQSQRKSPPKKADNGVNAGEKKAKKPAETYSENELCKIERKDLEAKLKVYEGISQCQPSDAGNALERLRTQALASVVQLMKFTARSEKIAEGSSTEKYLKSSMGTIVLFDYVLRERMIYNQGGADGPVKAGPVEQALNQGLIKGSTLIESPEFARLIGKFTPARAGAFLNNDESRNKVFDNAVRSALSPVKDGGVANQPAQPKAQAEMERAQPQPSKAAGIGMGGPG